MRKLFSLFAILLLAGVAQAAPNVYDPKTGGPSEFMPVYNNSGAALDAGDVVIWDIGSSTGDNDAYVTTTTTADTNLVAGVVWPAAIAATDIGSIIVYGMAECDIAGSGTGANTVLCSSATAGSGKVCGTASHNYGFSTVAISGGSQGACFVNTK